MGIILTITDSGCRSEFRLSKRQNLREPYQVFERYVALAREAAANGDRIASENFFQHAEHYFRIMSANGEANQHGTQRPMTPADADVSEPDGEIERKRRPTPTIVAYLAERRSIPSVLSLYRGAAPHPSTALEHSPAVVDFRHREGCATFELRHIGPRGTAETA
jgi:Domain of unknown function (DUF4167)